MYCSQCAKETEGPLFCEHCGAPLAPSPPPAQQPERRASIPRWLWIVGGLGVVGAFLLIGLIAIIIIIARTAETRAAAPSPTQVPPASPLPTRTPVIPQGTTPAVVAYYVDPNLVTNKQYIDFLYEMDPDQMNKQWGPDLYMGPEDEPAGWVAWLGADKYCSWLGGYLPTEKQLLEAGPARNAAYGYEWTSACYGDTCKHLSVFQDGNWGTEYRDASPDNIFFRCVLPVYEDNP